jgi:hypothetical protein
MYDKIVTRCCVCKKLKEVVNNIETWVKKAVPKDYFPSDTYCPVCYKAALESFQKEMEEPGKE